MSFVYPATNTVDLSWLGELAHLYPSSTTVNLTWEPKVPIVEIAVSGFFTTSDAFKIISSVGSPLPETRLLSG